MYRKTPCVVLILILLSVIILSACGGGAEDPGVTRPTPPPEYTGKTNPLGSDPNAVAAGQTVYTTNCASCHGESGQGDGPAGAALDPKPSNLIETARGSTDDYLYWRIAEGGPMEPFKSSMPAWKGILSEEQIWQVIAYIRSLAE
jgi:mono/diheme cytochrome c family protein